MTRYFLSLLTGLVLGGFTVWGVFAFTLAPNDADFRIRAVGHYAEQLSLYGIGSLASFKDCKLEEPDPFQRLRGVNWIGACSTSARGTGYVYTVQLDNWARHSGDDFRVLAP